MANSNGTLLKIVGTAGLAYIAYRYMYGAEKAKNGEKCLKKQKSTLSEQLLHIYFASQTGTSESFAEELSLFLKDLGIRTQVTDIDEFDEEKFLENEYYIFVVSTYGEGDPTDSAIGFYEWMRGLEPSSGSLSKIHYGVFGCGSQQYPDFNQAARDLDSLFEQNGATRMIDVGLGDDDGDIESDFHEWLETLNAPICEKMMPEGAVIEKSGPVMKELQCVLKMDNDAQELPRDRTVRREGADTLSKWIFQAYEVPIVSITQKRKKATNDDSTVQVDFDISRSRLAYNVADTAEVLPYNRKELVELFAHQFLKIEKDQMSTFLSWRRNTEIDKDEVKAPFPTPCTLEHALTRYVDLTMLPAKATLIQLALRCPNPEPIIELLSGPDFKTLQKAKISFSEFWMRYFSEISITLSEFLQICPRQKSRPYTIASSPKDRKGIVSLCVGKVTETLDTLEMDGGIERRYEGLCSSWMCDPTNPPEKALLMIKGSGFKPPANKAAPVIMIGSGTGLAPFRAFVQEFGKREVFPKRTMLFFGCRNPEEDYIYQDELEDYAEKITNFEIVTAFSRTQEKKVYVQHKVAERGDDIAQILKDGGYIYVCGAAGMGRDVEKEVEKILESHAMKLTTAQLKKSKRYYEELWG